ncbi:MJ0042-type zinc finger domain-containing protein [Parvularcula sp. LCG005]|uniref:MJ0042-type zinc finger domain-containing protein n=1 Tax=Parvularcula sp. LCG005 TaxID=3078805 RepID=UPI002943C7AA|nr:MJ0042-type zinc finger domain-containing protein [Parvularcula sp. LCG005]WOI53159.1 hypothetical protein RUI03_13505 [Parvularcula sp. LCG005]
MPQFEMKVLPPETVKGKEVLEHVAGSPAREGGGDETYRCGNCKTKLLVDVDHHDAHGVIVKCGKCGKYNIEPHHH